AGDPGVLTPHADGTWSWSYATTNDFTTTTVHVKATDENGTVVTDMFDISAANVAPSGDITVPNKVLFSTGFNVSLANVPDPSSVDTANLTYAFSCGDGGGFVSTGSTASRACTAPSTHGSITVGAKVTDDDTTTTYTKLITITQQAIGVDPATKPF